MGPRWCGSRGRWRRGSHFKRTRIVGAEVFIVGSIMEGQEGETSPSHHLDKNMVNEDEILENADSNVPPLQIHSSLSSVRLFRSTDRREIVESIEEDNWEETKTEFEDEEAEAEAAAIAERLRRGKQKLIEPVDENSSAMSLYRRDTTAMPVAVGRSGKTLEGIGKELDDHFLKASGCIKEIAVLIDINGGDTLLRQNSGHLDSKATYCVILIICCYWLVLTCWLLST